jgi:hypothetical protein
VFIGVHCIPLACDAESKVSAAIDAHLNLVFLVGEELFLMMLVLCSAATPLDALFCGVSSTVSSSDWVIA